MRVALWAKVCTLAVCTSVVTSSLVGQTGSGQERKSRMTIQRGRGAALKNGKPAPAVAEFHLRSMDVSSAGNSLVVKSGVDIFETRTNVAYLWKLKIVAGDAKKVVLERRFDDQMFKFQDGVNAHPTFAETVQLPAGDYRVEVTLYEIPDGFNLDALKTKATSKAQSVLRGVRTVSVVGEG
jgi:hypothetical protein